MNVAEVLRRNGYEIKDVFTTEGNGGNSAFSVKTINPNGRDVIVILDVPGNLDVTNAKKSLKVVETSDFPNSLKMSYYQCTKMKLCHVAFSCKENLCILRNEGNSMPDETYFSIDGNVAHMGEDLRVYPVVNLSDIINNNESVVEETDMIIKTFRTKKMEKITKDLKSMVAAVEEQKNALFNISQMLRDSLLVLRENFDILSEYEKNVSSSSEKQKVILNLNNQNSNLEQVILFMEDALSLYPQISHSRSKLQSIDREMKITIESFSDSVSL